jgi:hypothetical protein
MVILKHRRKAFQPAGGSFIMDTITATTHIAVSVRRLYSASTKCMELRRASDNATSDFGYDGAGTLDASAIDAWRSGSNVFVKTWYEQETDGAGTNLVQTTDAKQPQLVMFGGEYMPFWPGSGTVATMQWLKASASVSVSQPYQVYTITEDTESGSSNRRVFDGDSSGSSYLRIIATQGFWSIQLTGQRYYTGGRPYSLRQNTTLFDDASTAAWENGVSQTILRARTGPAALNGYNLGISFGENSENYKGYIPEFIIVNPLSGGDQTTLETDQIARFV